MFNVSFNANAMRLMSLTAAASVSVLLAACGGGTGSAQYSIDSNGNLTSASATTKLANGSTQSTTVSSTPSTTTGSTSTTTTTGTTTTTSPAPTAPTTTTGTTTTAPTTSTAPTTTTSPTTGTTAPSTTTTAPAPAPTTTTTTTTTTAMPYGQTGSNWTMTFSDEFTGTALNSARWNDTIWYETSNSTKNYAVSNGSLKIWPQRDATGKFFNRTIDTDGKYYQTYGYFEIEAKLPIGKGTWPAFWLFNHIGTRRPEIDIMEAYAGGGPASGWSDANFHPTAYAPTVWIDASRLAGTKTILTSDLSASFNKYAVKWEANKQTFYFNGREVYSLAVTMPDTMYIMLDLWYGSASGQPDSTTPTGIGNSYEINYVRAWKAS